MKKKGRIIVLVVAIGASIGLAYGILRVTPFPRIRDNLLKNWNFEAVRRSGKIKKWKQDSLGGWSVDSENPYQGDNSMRATVGWSWLNQEILVEPDRYYILTAFVRSDISLATGEQDDNTFFGFECLDAKNEVIRSDYGIISASSFWQQKMRQIYAPPGTRRIRIKLAKRRGEGSVWFDELSLEEFLSASINNPGFEIVDESGRPDYWAEDPMGGWSVDTEKAYQGNNSMQVTVAWSWLSQEIQVKPEAEYTVQVYSRSDIIIPRGIEDWNTFLALECLNKEGEIVGRNMIQLNVGSLWKPQLVSVYAPAGTEKMRVQLAKRQGGGSVWFDEPKIVKLTWYMKSTFVQRIAEDKPFFIFYFSVYFILLVLLLRLILKRQPSPKRQRVVLGKKSKESQN